MKSFKCNAVVWKEEDVYVAKCIELGLTATGSTVNEAVELLQDRIVKFLKNVEAEAESGGTEELEQGQRIYFC